MTKTGSLNGRFWRAVAVIVVAAFIIGVGGVGVSAIRTLDRIEVKLETIDTRVVSLENNINQRSTRWRQTW